MRLALVIPVLCLAAASPAVAQSLRPALTGFLGLGIDRDGRGDVVVDATAAFPLSGSIFLDLGAFGGPGSPRYAGYAALRWQGPAGELSVGAPRPAYDLYARSLFDDLLPSEAADPTEVLLTRSGATFAATQEGDQALGLLYQGDTGGGASWAVSVQSVPGEDLVVGSIGMGLREDAWQLDAAVEHSSEGDTAGKLTAGYTAGAVTAQLGGYSAPKREKSGTRIRRAIEAGLVWKASERLRLGALMRVPTGHGDKLSALAASYKLRGGAVSLGVTADGGKAAATLGVGWKF